MSGTEGLAEELAALAAGRNCVAAQVSLLLLLWLTPRARHLGGGRDRGLGIDPDYAAASRPSEEAGKDDVFESLGEIAKVLGASSTSASEVRSQQEAGPGAEAAPATAATAELSRGKPAVRHSVEVETASTGRRTARVTVDFSGQDFGVADTDLEVRRRGLHGTAGSRDPVPCALFLSVFLSLSLSLSRGGSDCSAAAVAAPDHRLERRFQGKRCFDSPWRGTRGCRLTCPSLQRTAT